MLRVLLLVASGTASARALAAVELPPFRPPILLLVLEEAPEGASARGAEVFPHVRVGQYVFRVARRLVSAVGTARARPCTQLVLCVSSQVEAQGAKVTRLRVAVMTEGFPQLQPKGKPTFTFAAEHPPFFPPILLVLFEEAREAAHALRAKYGANVAVRLNVPRIAAQLGFALGYGRRRLPCAQLGLCVRSQVLLEGTKVARRVAAVARGSPPELRPQ